MRLRALTTDDELAATSAHAELLAEHFSFLIGWTPQTPWAEYLERLERERLAIDLADDRVPCTFLVAVVDDEIVGRLSVRHELNEHLARIGGHIGYATLPAARRRGYATAMTRAGLGLLASMGVDQALLTCDDDNTASATVIERCGGRLQDVIDGTCRYWLPTSS